MCTSTLVEDGNGSKLVGAPVAKDENMPHGPKYATKITYYGTNEFLIDYFILEFNKNEEISMIFLLHVNTCQSIE